MPPCCLSARTSSAPKDDHTIRYDGMASPRDRHHHSLFKSRTVLRAKLACPRVEEAARLPACLPCTRTPLARIATCSCVHVGSWPRKREGCPSTERTSVENPQSIPKKPLEAERSCCAWLLLLVLLVLLVALRACFADAMPAALSLFASLPLCHPPSPSLPPSVSRPSDRSSIERHVRTTRKGGGAPPWASRRRGCRLALSATSSSRPWAWPLPALLAPGQGEWQSEAGREG